MSTAHLRLSIDIGSDPIRGSVATSTDAAREFCGWMELTEAIEAARAAHPSAPTPGASAGKD